MLCICEQCGQQRMFNEAHAAPRGLPIREIIAKMRPQ